VDGVAQGRQLGRDRRHSARLRHYFASVLIRSGLSIKAIQRLLGHKSAVETLDTDGHLMGDEDDRSRAAIRRELGHVADFLRTAQGP
jgi:integrase